MRLAGMAALLAMVAGWSPAAAGVVINEIFYHAPEDLDDVQWVELYNPGSAPVDISGWKLAKGTRFTFAPGTSIPADGYVVVALNPAHFKQIYRGIAAVGPTEEPLARKGGRIELVDAQGKVMDDARYKDREPWPVAADGYSSSIERISPAGPGDVAENWAASPLPADAMRPAGTPGKRNACYSAVLPPIVSVKGPAEEALAGQELKVEARVVDTAPLKQVALLYRTAVGGFEGKETTVEMTRQGNGTYAAAIPAQKAGTLVRYRVQAQTEQGATRTMPAETELRPTCSTYVHEPWQLAKVPFAFVVHARPAPGDAQGRNRRGGWFFGRGGGGEPGDLQARPKFGSSQPRPPRGTSAFVFVDPKTGKTTLYDHINIASRDMDRGFKVHFHKDRTFNGMTVISVIFEGSERFLLAEHLAYDLYRQAGNPASWSDFCRLWVDGRMSGYHLMIENPNRSFLRRHGIQDDGDLYKLLWMGSGVVGQHEKKTNVNTGHKDLVEFIQKLQVTRGEQQWKLIQENIDVNEVATYFAVNMVLSHWDGFFNNHFVYHDLKGTGKWQMYPWDQDKTWGYHDGLSEDEFFFDMPLSFGSNGDRPPGGQFGGPFGGGANIWWRRPGYFSGPLLANPQFRAVFLTKVRGILEKLYTVDHYTPIFQGLRDRLAEDAGLRAKMNGEREQEGIRRLDRNLKILRSHLEKRRAYLLAQKELAGGGGRAPAPGDDRPGDPSAR